MTGKGKLLMKAFGEIDVKYISDWDDYTDPLQDAKETTEESIISNTCEQLPCISDDMKNIQAP